MQLVHSFPSFFVGFFPFFFFFKCAVVSQGHTFLGCFQVPSKQDWGSTRLAISAQCVTLLMDSLCSRASHWVGKDLVRSASWSDSFPCLTQMPPFFLHKCFCPKNCSPNSSWLPRTPIRHIRHLSSLASRLVDLRFLHSGRIHVP